MGLGKPVASRPLGAASIDSADEIVAAREIDHLGRIVEKRLGGMAREDRPRHLGVVGAQDIIAGRSRSRRPGEPHVHVIDGRNANG